jgi:sugar O-acyltransferase (sialic acid O-acetyltransferase NeuD family)
MHAADAFVCWGAAGHARVLQDLLAETGTVCVAYIDTMANDQTFLGRPVFRTDDEFQTWRQKQSGFDNLKAIFAIGRQGGHRLAALERAQTLGLQTPVVCSRWAHISPSARLDMGSHVLPMAVVAAEVKLGRACIVNHAAVIDHECRLGDGVHVAPRATLCGQVVLGHDVFVGAGAVVLPRLNIGDRVMIGAGAVVTRDVPPGTTVLGNPASVYRSNHDNSK